MFALCAPERRLALSHAVVVLFLVAGCGREMSRSLAPEHDRQAASVTRDGTAFTVPANSSAKDLPPSATILSPIPNANIVAGFPTQSARIEWTGEDLDGHIREYRYRLFQSGNPDFPGVQDFIEFLDSDPQAVLDHYAPDFEGWERLRARKDSEPSSVTYDDLIPQRVYAFVVVAIDNRGQCDLGLSRNRNVLFFSTPAAVPGTLTFVGPFGELTNPTEPVVVTAGEPVTVQWFATPFPPRTVLGYVFGIDQAGAGEPSLDQTSATIPPPTSGTVRLLFVEVEYDTGVRSLHILQLQFTGSPLAASVARRAR